MKIRPCTDQLHMSGKEFRKVGAREVEAKYLVDQESFSFAEYWIDGHIEDEGSMGHSEALHHKWEIANIVQMAVEEYFEWHIYKTCGEPPE